MDDTGHPKTQSLLEEARYQVFLTDYSAPLESIKALIARHTRIPPEDVDEVLSERPAVLAEALDRQETDVLLEAFKGSGANIQAVARSVPGIEEVLDDFLLSTDAINVILMDRSGFKICERGDTTIMDVQRMLGLIAGVFAATRRIAQHLGEEEFSALFHPGQRASIHMNLVGERGIFISQFDRASSMRIVRLYANEAAKKLSQIL